MIRQQFERGSDKKEAVPERGDDEDADPSGRGSYEGWLDQPDETFQYQEQSEIKSEKKHDLPRRGSYEKRELPRRGSDKIQEQPGRGSG